MVSRRTSFRSRNDPHSHRRARVAAVVLACAADGAFGTALGHCGGAGGTSAATGASGATTTASDAAVADDSAAPTHATAPARDASADAYAASEAAADAAQDAVACDPTKDPKDEPCVVADAFGVFVATSGRSGATGTSADPLGTIADGVSTAVRTGKSRVYVCAGTYAGQVVIDAQHDGISLYGGLDCTHGWTWTGDKALVQAAPPAYALRIDATALPVRVEDMAFAVADASGQDATGAGRSSVAAFVSDESSGVALRRVELRAG